MLAICQILFAQSDGQIKITGDKLIGKRIDGQMIREVIGNVVMTQKDVVITCDTAIQYLAKNEAELIGNVVAHQDTIVISTPRAYYYGDSSIAYSESGVVLNDGTVTLTASNGFYYFDIEEAYFYTEVSLKDSALNLYSDRLRFYHKDDLASAAGNVVVADSTSFLFADSLLNYRQTKITYAYNDIHIINEQQGVNLFGEFLFDDPENNYNKIEGNPLLLQIDTLDTGELDTLFVNCKIMESVAGASNLLIASDSVKILRGGFSSVNDQSLFYRSEDRIQTYKQNEKKQPVMWFEDSQLSGDTIDIFLQENYLKSIQILEKSFILSKHKGYDYRYDQISGDTLKLFFDGNSLSRTEVYGHVLSIYYMFDEEEPNGLIKSSSEVTKIGFDSSKVVSVNMYGLSESEFHPENLIEGNEQDFTLPAFIIFNNRPTKSDVFSNHRKLLMDNNYIRKTKYLVK